MKLERAMHRGFAVFGIVLGVLLTAGLVAIAILNWRHADYGLLAINLACMPIGIGGIYMAARALRMSRGLPRELTPGAPWRNLPSGGELKPDANGTIHHPLFGDYPEEVPFRGAGMVLMPGQKVIIDIPVPFRKPNDRGN